MQGVVPTVFVQRSARQAHPYQRRGFLQVSLEGLEELEARFADHTLGMQAVRVLVAMARRADFENRVWVSQKDLGAHLKMSQSEVSAAQGRLAECGFLRRSGPRGFYSISPKLLWKGSARTLKAALAEAA